MAVKSLSTQGPPKSMGCLNGVLTHRRAEWHLIAYYAAEPMEALRLLVLGRTQLVAGDGLLRIGAGKSLALITYLSSSPRRAATRDHLIDLLWANVDADRARRTLRQTLFQLRRDLGSDLIASDTDSVILSTSVATDRDDFLSAVQSGDAARAVDCYSGDFFPAFAAPGASVFEQWADQERARLRSMFCRALESLTRDSMRQGRHREAVNLGRRLRAAAPDREEGWRLLLEALVASGDWLQSTTEADALDAMLRSEGRRPDRATSLAIQRARNSPTQEQHSDLGLVAEMLGREAEFAAIVSAWESAQRGRSRHVHVSGAAGIGKTRLLNDAAARVASLGGAMALVGATPAERDIAYSLAAGIVRTLVDMRGAVGIMPHSAGILVGLEPRIADALKATPIVPEPEERLRLRCGAIAELLSAISHEQPVALFVDDLHWADADSAQVLSVIAAKADAGRVLLVTASRPRSLTPAGSGTLALSLGPLDRLQVQAITSSIATVPESLATTGLVDALHSTSGGTPLLVLEMLQLALERGWLELRDHEWFAREPGGIALALRSGSAVDLRLTTLGNAERVLMSLLALAQMPMPISVLERAASDLFIEAAPNVSALEQRALVTTLGDRCEIAHDAVAERVAASVDNNESRRIHVALGAAFSSHAVERPEYAILGARFLARAGDISALQHAFRAFVISKRREGGNRPALELAHDLVGPTHEALIPQLMAGLPLLARWRLTPKKVGLLTGVAILLGALGVRSLTVPTPDHLVLEQKPIVAGTTGQPPFVVGILDRNGRPVFDLRDSVRIELAIGAKDWTLSGPIAALPVNGRVNFGLLPLVPRISRPAPFVTIRASYAGLNPVETDTIMANAFAGRLLVDSLIAGHQLLGRADTLFVAPQGRVIARVFVRYNTAAGPASVLAVAVPTWGDRRTAFWPLRALSANAFDERSEWALEFVAPNEPGVYRIHMVATTETEAQFVASGTNWSLGQAIWNDGNDIRDWGPTQIEEAMRAGRVSWSWRFPPPHERQRLAALPAQVRLRRTTTEVHPQTVLATSFVIRVSAYPE